ncbi:Uma2 family endonuclease [Azospirillum halopraeferens]|uniref:Uma2 family endonuclease n=1 Tax=Azospirillum halopraeferens TaxID=34010 RepID=UPI0006841D25|nr:Uma2 family endonuclease [Azospirillum halopraeferens]
MSEAARTYMTVDEFLLWEDGTDTRYELIGGEPVAMAPPADAHALLAGAITVEIGRRLKPPCRVRVEAGIRIPHRNDMWFQADVAVGCGPASGRPGTAEPRVVVEVLSPSTESDDRTVKLPLYRTVPSIREILLISARERRAELWHRTGGAWLVEEIDGAGTLTLASVDVSIPMEALYEGLPR